MNKMSVFLVASFLTLQVHATSRVECEIELLSNAGKAFMGLVEKGLGTGDVTHESLVNLIVNAKPAIPLAKDRSESNLHMRDGFQRVIKKLKPEDWPAVFAVLRLLTDHKVVEAEKTEHAAKETAGVFSIQSTGLEFPPGTKILEQFVSSKGEIYVHYVSNEIYKVLEVNSKREYLLTEKMPQNLTFMEADSGEVLMAYSDSFRALYVKRAADGGLMHSLDLRSVKGNSELSGDDLGLTLFKKNGHPYLAAYYPARSEFTNVSHRPATLIDLVTKEIEQIEIPNSRLSVKLSTNGHFYAMGIGANPNGRTLLFLTDLTEGKQLVFHWLAQYHEMFHLSPILLFDPDGNPVMHGFNAKVEIIEIGATGRLTKITDLKAFHFSSYIDGDGKVKYVRDGWEGGRSHHYHGDLKTPEKMPLPLGGSSPLVQLNMVKYYGGLVSVGWFHSMNRESYLLINDFSELGWIKISTRDRTDAVEVMTPFYDPAQRRILIFMKNSRDVWKLFQIFGREAAY